MSYDVLIATFAKVLARGGEGDPNRVGMVLGDLRGVSVRIGVRCGWQSWNLRGLDRSFAMFRAGVVRGLRGVGVGEVVCDVLGLSLSVVLEVHASLAVFTERLSSSLVLLLVLDRACTRCSSLLDRRLLCWPSRWSILVVVRWRRQRWMVAVWLLIHCRG